MLARMRLLLVAAILAAPLTVYSADWSAEQAAKLPAGETPVSLFNGKDLAGWTGHKDQYFSVVDGVIAGKNSGYASPSASQFWKISRQFPS